MTPSELLQGALAQGVGSGYAFSIGGPGGPWTRAWGGTVRHGGSAVDADTRWDLASITKVITGVAFARLIEEGQVDTETTVQSVLPDFADATSANTTVGQLLCHTSGLPGQHRLYRYCADADALRSAVRELPLRNPPGTAVEYSSQGFMVLGWMLEAVIDQSLDVALADMVFGPFGMRAAGFQATTPFPKETADRFVATEECPWRERMVQGTVHDENAVVMGGTGGHAGLFSTLADLEAFATGLLRIWRGEATGPLRHDSLTASVRNQTAGTRACMPGRAFPSARGWGWQLGADPDAATGDLCAPTAFGHTGFTGTSVFIDPTSERYAILLTNRVHPSRQEPRIDAIRRKFHNLAAAINHR